MRDFWVVLGLGSLFVSGCSVGPNYQQPTLVVPERWQAVAANAESNAPSNTLAAQWWQAFNDPVLNQLISEAAASNLDLQQALARIKEARAQRIVIFAGALPSVTAKSNVSRRLNNSSSSAQSGSVGGGFGVGNQLINIFQSGFDAQWELDLFGGSKRTAESADANLAAEIESSRAVWVSLLAEVAENYIELRANQRLLTMTQAMLGLQQETADLMQVRQHAGLSNSLEVTQAQAQLASTEAQRFVYERDIQLGIHALSVLLGKEPNTLATRLQPVRPIPSVVHLSVTELPSELLQRRPDIRRAERQLAANSAAIGMATAELYPKLNLSAFFGLQNMRLTDVTPLGKSWSTAASISMPIFNWGRLKANIKSKEAQAEAALLAYQAVVLKAFKEVEDALVAHSKELNRQQALQQAVDANRLAVQLANERYQKGLTGFIEVLQSQQALFQAETALIGSQTALSSQVVALYKALGGGWQTLAKLNDCAECEKSWAEHLRDAANAMPRFK